MSVLTCTRNSAIAAASAVLALAPGLSTPAGAAEVGDTLERGVLVEWVTLGATPEVAGNVHVGRFEARVPVGEEAVSWSYGETHDYTCPVGYVPDGLWIEAMAQLDTDCVWEDGLVFPEGPAANLDVHVAGKLHAARAVGTLDYIHAGPGPSGPGVLAVDLRWDAPGEKTVVRSVHHRPRQVTVVTSREATVTGTVGAEVIGAGDQASWGQTFRYRFTQLPPG